MRGQILELIRCNHCGSTPLDLEITEEDHLEILEGKLWCTKCGLTYPIIEGVINTIQNETIPELLTAQESEETLNKELNDEWLLSLPYPKHHPTDTTFEIKGGDKAVNFFDMLDRMELKGNETILELGAGNCWATNIFAQRGCRCIATDVRMRRYYGLRSGRIFINHQGHFFERVLSDLENPPFADNVFDVVFAQSSLQYATNLNGCLSEISRVLKPGGRLVSAYSGVYGLFKQRNNKSPGYFLPKLMKALRKTRLKGQLIFPIYIEKHFREGVPQDKPFYHIGNMFSRIWNRIPWLHMPFRKIGPYPLSLFFGVPVNLIARKE